MMPVVTQMAPQQQQVVPVQSASNTVAVYSEQNTMESFNSEDIGQNLVAIQNHLRSLQLMSSARQQLQLLLQRQHIEHEELKLRHFLELEKFLKQQKEDMKPALQQQQQQPAAVAAAPPQPQQQPQPVPVQQVPIQSAPVPQQQQQQPQPQMVPGAILADITSPTLTVSRGFDQNTITTPSYNNYSTIGSSSSGGSGPELLNDLDASLTIVNETNK